MVCSWFSIGFLILENFSFRFLVVSVFCSFCSVIRLEMLMWLIVVIIISMCCGGLIFL